jgi:hypothetical protein
MAFTEQPVLADTPSQVVEELRKQFNALLDVLDAMASNASDLQSLAQAGVKKVTTTKTLPTARRFPTK